MVIALNMVDLARAQGDGIDHERLSASLGSIVPTVGTTGEGVDELLDAAIRVAEGSPTIN